MERDVLFGVMGAAGTLVAIVSLVCSVVARRRSRREKRLVYESLTPIPIAEVIPERSQYSLKVAYGQTGPGLALVDRAFIQYVRFSNFGREPIREQDLAPSDPLRIEAVGDNVLDISLANVTREVCNIRLGEVSKEEDRTLGVIVFDFLDFEDGGLLQVLTESEPSEVSVFGTVIGMPEGLIRAKQQRSQEVSGVACIVPLAIQIIALLAVPAVYYLIKGSWEDVALLGLPVVALLVPGALSLLALFLSGPRAEFRFSDLLSPPQWYAYRLALHERMRSPRSAGARDWD